MWIAVLGLLIAAIALALAIRTWQALPLELQALRAELADARREAGECRQLAVELESAAAASRLAAQRTLDSAVVSAQASREAAAAAQASADAAAQTAGEASHTAEASGVSAKASLSSARSAENAAQSALRAAAAAEAFVRTGEQQAQGWLASAKAAEQAAASARQSAQASAETARSNWALTELGKRAWVHATEFRAALKTQGAENSTLEIRIANLGNTPARELKVSTNFHIEDEVPDELSLKPRANNIVLGPGVGFSISHFLRVSPADLAAISTGRRVLLACGQADYVDVLGVARQTRWCAVYNVNGNSFTPAAKHNLTA